MFRAAALSLLLCLSAAPVAAAEDPLPAGQYADARLLRGWRQDDGTHVAAIAIRLAPGWHTYWRSPGDVGIPPDFDWAGSRNLAAVEYEWPKPELFESFGLVSVGYARELVLPVRLVPADPGQAIEVALEATFGVCRDICMQTAALMSASLGPTDLPESRAIIEAALAERAFGPAEAGVSEATCAVEADASGLGLVTEVTFLQPPLTSQHVVVETGNPNLRVGFPDSRTEGNKVIAHARLDGDGAAAIERRSIRITVLDEQRAIDIPGCVASR